MGLNIWILLLLVLVSGGATGLGPGTFAVDYERNCFSKDGSCFQYVSGSIHYFRVPPVYWRDRLQKMYMAGLNAIQMYVAWNFHEMTPGVFDFTEWRDIEQFVRLAQDMGLLVILRPGPYICAEWDLGGLPAWLLQNTSIVLRSSDAGYLAAVDRWFGALLPRMRPLLYHNGGPIISMQVENEYGSYYTCDYEYLRHLHHLVRAHLGDQVLLFTTDGNRLRELRCGTMQGMYATVDFGTAEDITASFEVQRQFEPSGPLVNSELYVGWLDYWGVEHSLVPVANVTRTLHQLLDLGASVSMYMFEGGTNFGYWNGADYNNKYRPITTSYDYDAPLSEAGDPREKLHAVRSVIAQFRKVPVGPMPPPTTKFTYGQVTLTRVGPLLDFLSDLAPEGATNSTHPLTFEEMHQYFGLMLYRTLVPGGAETPTPLGSPHNVVRDRAYVLVNGLFQGVLERDGVLQINISGRPGDPLDLLLENCGRINFGSSMADHKGLVGNLSLGAAELQDWRIFPLAIDRLVASGWPHPVSGEGGNPSPSTPPVPQPPPPGPTFYSGTFSSSEPLDTFMWLQGWTKGQVWVNGFNLGRYWPARGPQQTLYVPRSVLTADRPNEVTVLELEQAPAVPTVQLLDHVIMTAQI